MTYQGHSNSVKIDEMQKILEASKLLNDLLIKDKELKQAKNDYLSAAAYATLRKRPYSPNLGIHLNRIHAASDELKNIEASIEARLKEGKNES